MTEASPTAAAERTPLREIALLFLRLGATAFGGPAAHIAMMQDEVVTRRRWLTEERFLDLLGATNLIPGPNSTEMAIHIGWERRRWAGLLVAGVSFIVPAALITGAIGWAYVRFGELPAAGWLLYGVKPVILAIVAQAIWKLAPKAARTGSLRILGVLAALATALGAHELLVLFGTGFFSVVFARVGGGHSGPGRRPAGGGQSATAGGGQSATAGGGQSAARRDGQSAVMNDGESAASGDGQSAAMSPGANPFGDGENPGADRGRGASGDGKNAATDRGQSATDAGSITEQSDGQSATGDAGRRAPGGRGASRPQIPMFLPLLSASAGGAAATTVTLPSLFWLFLKTGSVLFGSGYVLLAFLRADLVHRLHWMTEGQLIDAIAVGQITPGPVFTTATFIGYVLSGPEGALLATTGIFLPAFVFVALSGPLVPRLRASASAGAFLDGVNVASLVLMAVVTAQLGRAALVDVPTIALSALGAVILFRYKVNSTWLVLGGAAAGWLVHAAGLAAG